MYIHLYIYTHSQFHKLLDIPTLMVHLFFGVNAASITMRKSAQGCCVIVAQAITGQVFYESVMSSDLTDDQVK